MYRIYFVYIVDTQENIKYVNHQSVGKHVLAGKTKAIMYSLKF